MKEKIRNNEIKENTKDKNKMNNKDENMNRKIKLVFRKYNDNKNIIMFYNEYVSDEMTNYVNHESIINEKVKDNKAITKKEKLDNKAITKKEKLDNKAITKKEKLDNKAIIKKEKEENDTILKEEYLYNNLSQELVQKARNEVIMRNLLYMQLNEKEKELIDLRYTYKVPIIEICNLYFFSESTYYRRMKKILKKLNNYCLIFRELFED